MVNSYFPSAGVSVTRSNHKGNMWDFPGGLIVNISSSNVGDAGSIPSPEAKIPCASWQKNENIKQKECCNNTVSNTVNSIKTLKMARVKKIFLKKAICACITRFY